MRIIPCALWSAAVFLSLTPASAAPLIPTDKWHVDFADSQCVASRNYGSDANPIFLVLKKPALGDVLQIAVVRNGSFKQPDQFEGDVSFDEKAPIETSVLEYGVKKLRQQALMINLSTSDLSPMRHASSIRIRSQVGESKGGGPSVVRAGTGTDMAFALGEVRRVLDLLDECARDLQTVWNVWDENRDSVTLKKGPQGDLRNLFSGRDYPLAAMQKNQMGTASFVLLIDEAGKVQDCIVTRTSGVATIDAQSCAIVKERGKFRPAIGLDGKPAKSSISESITWRLEG